MDIIQRTLIDIIVRQAMQLLLSKLPFLSFGPLNLIVGFFVEKLVTILVEETILGLNFLYIDIKTEAQLREYNKIMDEIQERILMGDTDEETLDKMVADAARKFFSIGIMHYGPARYRSLQKTPE